MAKAAKVDLAQVSALLDQLRGELASTREENSRLREQVDAQTQAAAHHQLRHASMNPRHSIANSELMVGIRSVSNNTVGITGYPEGAPDITLNPDVPGSDNTTAIVSYVHWTRLRNSDFVKKGFIIRDDSVLGTAFMAAPADRPEDLPAEAALNTIVDPEAWIAERDDDALTRDIQAVTSEDTLRRLMSVVDRWLYEYQKALPDSWTEKAAREALSRLPSKLKKVDDLVVGKLQDMAPGSDAAISNIELSVADVARMRGALRMR